MKLDTAAEANDRKTTTEQPSEMPEWSFSFACAGWLSLYLYGVAKAFQDHDVGQRARLIGSSAGSFAAVALALDIDLCEIRDHHLKVMAPQARDGLSGAFAVGRLTSEAIQAIRGLERFQSLNSRAFPFTVVYTSLSRGKSVRISQFDSQEHLEQCLLASSRAVPIAGLPFKLKGEWVLDGGMLDSQPLFKEGKTVTISPFHFADADIRPSRYLPPWWACYAPEPEELAWVFDLGREDGLAWIATNVPSKRVTVPSVARSSTRKWQTRCGQVVGYRMFDTAAFDALFTVMLSFIIYPPLLGFLVIEVAFLAVNPHLPSSSRTLSQEALRALLSPRTTRALFFSSSPSCQRMRLAPPVENHLQAHSVVFRSIARTPLG